MSVASSEVSLSPDDRRRRNNDCGQMYLSNLNHARDHLSRRPATKQEMDLLESMHGPRMMRYLTASRREFKGMSPGVSSGRAPPLTHRSQRSGHRSSRSHGRRRRSHASSSSDL